MFRLLQKLRKIRLLSLTGCVALLRAIAGSGVNLMTLLRVAASLHPERIAIVAGRERLTYGQLWRQAEALACSLHADFGLRGGQHVAIVCRSHGAAIKAIFAVSRLGANLYLINPEMSIEQLAALAGRLRLKCVIYDQQVASAFSGPEARLIALPAYHATDHSVDLIATSGALQSRRLPRTKAGNIVVLTSGTTGHPKTAGRRPSLINFLQPFFAFLTQVHLDERRSLYVATPIYHGHGLAFLFIGLVLGAELYFTERFDAKQACALIAEYRIEAITVVPLMLQRILKLDAESLASLRCIISGSAPLSPALASTTINQLGPILFNLYGSSEAGFCLIASPELLARKPASVGRPIRGVQVRIVDATGDDVATGETGQLCVRSAWTANRESWIETGDLAFRDAEGDITLCGRADDMIVSGGEKVYPVELERILTQHPEIEMAAVVGVPDHEFGQRLRAIVVRKRDTLLDQATLMEWLKQRVARYQMPATIDFRDELPFTSLGKIDKKALASE